MAKPKRYTHSVKWVRRVFLGLLVVLSFHAGLELLILLNEVPGLRWPAMLVRTFLVLLGGPAQLVGNWFAIHHGLWLPQPLWDLTLVFAYAGLWQAGKRVKTALQSQPNVRRRAFLAGGTALAATSVGIRNAYGELKTVERELPLKDLPPSLEGLRVVLLADLHRGPVISKEYLDQVVARVNQLEPDLVLMPGDFVSKSEVYFRDVTRVLKNLRPRVASLATLGNHDHWEGADKAKAALEKAGVVVLHNSSLHLDPARRLCTRGRSGLCLAGVDDLWEGQPDLRQALGNVLPGVPTLLLSHNPDFAEEKQAKETELRVDFQVSGHTHGGQVVLPGVGPATTGSRYGLKYMYGWVQGPRWPVFVTRGIGTSIVPIRVGAPPEVVLFTLSRQAAPPADQDLTC